MRQPVLRPEPDTTAAEEIIREVAGKHDLQYRDLTTPGRFRHIVVARWEAVYCVADACPWLSFSSIGRLFRIDHATVTYSIRQHAKISGKPIVTRMNNSGLSSDGREGILALALSELGPKAVPTMYLKIIDGQIHQMWRGSRKSVWLPLVDDSAVNFCPPHPTKEIAA